MTSRDDVVLTSGQTSLNFLFSRKRAEDPTVLVVLEVDTEDHEKAQLMAAGRIIPPALDVLSYSSGAPTLLAECELALKSESGNQERKGIYVGRSRSSRPIPLLEEAVQMGAAILAADGPKLPLCWLRYSHQRELSLERFVFAWLAFEELAGDADLTVKCPNCGTPAECPTCHSVITRRGANREKAWEIFHVANPEVTRQHFDREVWGRARSSLFHGGRYPEPEFLQALSVLTPQLQEATRREIQERYRLGPVPGAISSPIYRVFLFFSWNTNQIEQPYPNDWPERELRRIVDDAELGGAGINFPEILTLLQHRDFRGW
jgi:hypothetical protein